MAEGAFALGIGKCENIQLAVFLHRRSQIHHFPVDFPGGGSPRQPLADILGDFNDGLRLIVLFYRTIFQRDFHKCAPFLLSGSMAAEISFRISCSRPGGRQGLSFRICCKWPKKHRGGDDRCPPDALPGLSRKKPPPSAFRQKGRGIRSRGSTLFEPAYCRNHFFSTITESPGRIGAAPRWSSDRSVTEDFQLMSSSLGPSLSYSSHQRFGFSDLYYIRLEPVVNREMNTSGRYCLAAAGIHTACKVCRGQGSLSGGFV